MLKKTLVITDVAICSVWLLLLAHGLRDGGGTNPLFLFLLALRIWAAFLMHRGSKLMLAPVVMMSLVGALVFIGNPRSPDYFLFVEPWGKLLTSGGALFLAGTSFNPADFATEIGNHAFIFKLLGCVWLFVLPWCVYVWLLCRKQLHPCSLGIWRSAGLCAYILAIALSGAVLLSVTHYTIAVPVVVLMLLLAPVIFNHGRVRQMLNRGEKAYLAALAIIFVAGYVYDIIRHKIVSNERVEDIITSDSTAVRMPVVQDTAFELTDLEAGREDGDVCVSQDGRVTIESGVIPGGGSAPDYWARWTVTDIAGTERVIELPDAPYQYAVNTITKKDGTVYYIVSCYARLGGAYVEEWLEAYRIDGGGIQQVNVADGGRDTDNSAFDVIYCPSDWRHASGDAAFGRILEYNEHAGEIYVPATMENGDPTDRCVVWHFDGDRFVRRGERPRRGMHD